MSKLPPLPQATERCWVGSITSGNWEGLIRESVVREYGQQCRDSAFDEAADYCDKLQVYPATEPRHCAEDIRILKNESADLKASA